MEDLDQLIDAVVDQQSFLRFAEALMADREHKEGREVNDVGFVGDWANNDIWGYLEAAIAWAQDTDFGESCEPPLTNVWQQFAMFLHSGKFYE